MHKAIRGDKAAGAFGAVAVLACCCGFLVLQVACGEAGLNETASETVQSLRLGEESPSLDEAAPFSVRCATPLHSIVYPGITEAIGHVVLDIQKDAIGSASDASVFASIRVNGPSSDSAIYLAEASFDIPQETADGQSSVSMPIEIRWSGLDANGQPIPPDQLLDLSADLELRVLGRDTDSAGSVGSATVVFQVRTRDPSTYSRRAFLLEQLVRSAEVARACATESPDNDVAAELSGLPQSGLPMALDERGFLRKLGGPRTSLPMDASEAGIDLEPAQVARSFIDTYKELFGIGEPRVELLHESTRSVQNGAIVHFSQLSSQGLPVFDGQVFVYVNPEGSIREIRSSANAVGTFDLSAAVPGEESTSFALGYLNAAGICLNALTNGEPTLGVMTLDSCAPKLVWQTLFDCLDGDSYTVYVDAFDGRILNCRPRSLSVGPYQIRYLDPPPEYVPGTFVYEYPSGYTHPLGFGAFLDTFRLNQHTFTTLDYYGTRFGRDGWDDGQIPEGHVAVTQANWPGISGCFPCQFPYGRVAINHADVCLDVVAHEYGHLVAIADIGGYSQLYWQHQAISEGMSDFVGEMTEAFLVGTPDWIVGTELDQSTDNCSPYRSLSDPTSDNPVSPSHWNDSGQTIESHQQSGPLRKAGWLMGRETAEGWASFAGIGATGIGAVDPLVA